MCNKISFIENLSLLEMKKNFVYGNTNPIERLEIILTNLKSDEVAKMGGGAFTIKMANYRLKNSKKHTMKKVILNCYGKEKHI